MLNTGTILDILLPPFMILFVTMDPIGNMPIFMTLTESPRPDYRKAMAKRAVMIGGIVLLAFAFAGEIFLTSLSISLSAFRIAGGILLFVVALQMIFVEEQKEKAAETDNPFENDVSVFPLAVPLIAGPGTIASIILMMSERHGSFAGQAAVIAALFAVLLISYVLFRLSNFFARLLGQTVNQVISKILGIVLAAMAAQFVIDGIVAVVGQTG